MTSPIIRFPSRPAAFDAITATLPLGSVGYESEPNEQSERYVWLEAAMVDRLRATRGPARATANVILRVAAAKGPRERGGDTMMT
jgi:hypothetical protein